MQPDVLGINCATGPAEMQEHLRYLSQHSPLPISVLPNAGLPSIVDGRTHYDLTPEQLADVPPPPRRRARRRHRRRLLRHDARAPAPGRRGGRATSSRRRRTPDVRAERVVDLQPGDDRAGPQLPDHRRAHERQRLEGVPRRDARRRLGHAARRWPTSRSARAPTCSTCASTTSAATAPSTWTRSPSASPPRPACRSCSTPPSRRCWRPALQHIGGRAILNSANLEDGELPGSRFDRVMSLAREYGAAVICLLIDERGQARDVEWKMEIAHRIHEIAVERYGLSAERPDLRRADVPAVDRRRRPAPRRHRTRSRRSGGSRPRSPAPTRRSACPTSASASTRPPATRSTACSSTSACRPGSTRRSSTPARSCRSTGSPTSSARSASTWSTTAADPTTTRCSSCSRCSPTSSRRRPRRTTAAGWPVEERLQAPHHRRRPRRPRPPTSTRRWPAASPPLDIVNDVLLDGMKVVGELFGSGQMQLPFVLQSAETMKAAVAYLEPHMEKVGGASAKGKLVLATVKGDVHDIGKNLVDIICTNNGYEVHNLGIKVADRRHGRQGQGGRRRRPRHERPAREVDADHARQPRGAQRARPDRDARAARRRGADPPLRRARPARGLRGPAVLRPRRVRGPAHARRADGR